MESEIPVQILEIQCASWDCYVDPGVSVSSVDCVTSLWILGFLCGYLDSCVVCCISMWIVVGHCGYWDSSVEAEISVRILIFQCGISVWFKGLEHESLVSNVNPGILVGILGFQCKLSDF